MHARRSSARAGVRSSSGSGNERASPIPVYRRRASRLEGPRSAPISMSNALRWPRTALGGATRTGRRPMAPPRRRPSAEGTSPARDRLASRRHLRLDRRVVSSPGGEYNAWRPARDLDRPRPRARFIVVWRACATPARSSRQFSTGTSSRSARRSPGDSRSPDPRSVDHPSGAADDRRWQLALT
jgi:hypothetical protein